MGYLINTLLQMVRSLAEYSRTRIMKSGHYLPKIWTDKAGSFFGTVESYHTAKNPESPSHRDATDTRSPGQTDKQTELR